jgi:hypothetical protein
MKKLKRFVVNVEEMPEDIEAKNLDEAVKIAMMNVDVHEVDEDGEIVD